MNRRSTPRRNAQRAGGAGSRPGTRGGSSPVSRSLKEVLGDAGIPAVTRGSRSVFVDPSESSDPLRRINKVVTREHPSFCGQGAFYYYSAL